MMRYLVHTVRSGVYSFIRSQFCLEMIVLLRNSPMTPKALRTKRFHFMPSRDRGGW